MTHHTNELARQHALRTQALSRLTGHHSPAGTRSNASAALGVLHQLASSPSTAADALALLHELQVHQVEVELQDEELHRSRTELEADLLRLTQCHDHAPVGCFTIDRGTVLCEVNLTGARLLGVARDALPGLALDAFLTPPGVGKLQALLAQVDADAETHPVCTLELVARGGQRRVVDASVAPDPAGGRYLLALHTAP
jgi:PAS domain S-box-containing protein